MTTNKRRRRPRATGTSCGGPRSRRLRSSPAVRGIRSASSDLDSLLAPFKESLADLVDALIGTLEVDEAAAIHAAIASGTTLRLAVNVAPAFALSLYLVGPGGSPGIVVGGYGPASNVSARNDSPAAPN